ncbi:MAG TPA: hypothetical protein VHZ03_15695 [Trebonia sp.]|jgi:hypothetical protein|nr:hypothetical protein [Trebonia sp.]
MSATTKSRGRRDNPYVLDDLFVTVHRSAVGTAWRWRTEIITLASLAAAYCWLWSQLTVIWAAVVLAAFLVIVLGVPVTRRFTVRRFWCVLSRHRFHRMCFEGRLHTRAGRVPPVLWVRPTKVGERLLIWVRAGLAAEDFEQHTGELRAACYAREARVIRNTRWSQLVTIDIIRRDTLAASQAPESPFKKLLAEHARPAAPALADDDEPVELFGSRRPWPQKGTRNPD